MIRSPNHRQPGIPIIVLAIPLLALVVIVAGFRWIQKRSLPAAFAQDAAQVIASEAGARYAEDPATPDEEIEDLILSLHEASVINLQLDDRGRAVDPFGTPFRVENTVSGNRSITTAASAGPDGVFGTGDDIEARNERKREGTG